MEKTKLLILRVTERCNLACRYCYAAPEAGKDDMRLDIAAKSIALFANSGDKLKIQFTGGEPLLCTGLMRDIFEYVKRQGIQASFSVQTNGTLLSRESCELLKEMHCAAGVSIDGIGGANALRAYQDGTNAFNDAVAGIKTLSACGLYCNLNAVITSVNQRYLYQLIELAAYLGNVGGIGLDMFRPLGRGSLNNYAPDEKTLHSDLTHMLKKHSELSRLGITIRLKELEKIRFMLRNNARESCYCYAQTGLSAAVDPRGGIYPCSSLAGMPGLCIGSADSGLGAVPGQVREAACACKECAEFPLCRGGCPAGRIAWGGVSRCDCIMHRTFIEYGRNENA